MDFFDETVLKKHRKSRDGRGGVNQEAVGLPLIHHEIAVFADDVPLTVRFSD